MCLIRSIAAGLIMFFLSFPSNSQPLLRILAPNHLVIGIFKTTNVIFPFAIVSVDRGSAAVLAQKARGVNNILQLKAAGKDFDETNLSVVTADGSFYSFIVRYAANPSVLNVSVGGQGDPASTIVAQVADQLVAPDILAVVAARIRALRPLLHIGTTNQSVHLQLRNVSADSTCLWFSLRLSNHSAMGFYPDIVRFYVREKHQAKRTAVQEIDLHPVYMDTMRMVTVSSPLFIVLAFPFFTVKTTQRFYIQLGERSGSRLLTLPVRCKRLLKAGPIKKSLFM